jgi:hypothetical protein
MATPPYFQELIEIAKNYIQEKRCTNIDEIVIRLMGEADYVSRDRAEIAAKMAMSILHDEGVGIYSKKISVYGAPLFKCYGDEKED